MKTPQESEFDFAELRQRMVREQLERRDIRDPLVLEAFGTVERHRFIEPSSWDEAYEDHPVRIGCDQTISQPYIVALMTQALQAEPGQRVLEIGTGSGYQTAILAAMGLEVHTLERHEPLLERAAAVLSDLGLDERVAYLLGDGTLGHPEAAPYDRIIVTAAAPEVPPALREQLSPEGGVMVLPVGRGSQELLRLRREGESLERESLLPVVFVPLVGEQGF
jgi:protein-L-isoaspartate(D-aspartate) O-methyltransferase